MILTKFCLGFIGVLLFYREASAQCSPGSRDATTNCVVFDDLHMKTFDGNVYSYNSKCGYTLTSIKSNGINLEVNLLRNSSTLQVMFDGHTFDLTVTESAVELLRDGKAQTVPHSSFGVWISKPGTMVIVELRDIGMKIRYDGKTTEIIQNNQNNDHTMIGMCGDNDGCPTNDLVMKNGKRTTSTTQFADSWSIGGCTSKPFVNSCGSNSRLKAQAQAFCNSLFSNQKFSKCGAYSSQFMDICTSNYCNCKLANRNDCMCDMLDAYVRTCQIKNNEIISWRSSALCPIDCRITEQEYMTCAPNKRQLSCGEEEIDPSKYDCEEGCYCPSGLRLYQDRCLFVDECPCVYNDAVYNPGASIAQECNTCTCKKGQWECTNKICTVDGGCVADPHCTTFDGKKYDFMGKCTYYLVRGLGFDVMCDHYIWNGAFVKDVTSTAPSYCAKVLVQIKDDVIELEQNHVVKVNGFQLDWLPYVVPSFRISQPSSELTTVSLRNMVTVSWNGHSRADVSIPTTMRGRVKGLLGTYTKTQDDDFLMPNGTITTDPTEFGNSWKVPGSCENEYTGPVENPCSKNPSKKAKAERACSLLKSNIFEGCVENIDDDYDNCMYDACQCPDEQTTCVCEFYAVQGDRCAAKGKYVDWRKNVTECAINCPAGQTYQVCGNSCTRSCEDISANPTCEQSCVDGCNCPEGQTLNNKKQCIPISRCPCVWEEARYNPDFTFIDDDKKYTCTNAKWNITTVTPEDKDKYPPINELKDKCKADNFLVYSGCKRTNTVTCQNKHLNEQADYDNCQSGCQCMEGFVYDTELKICVRPDDCPCMYNGVSYPDKSERNERGQKCVCRDGFWSCNPTTDHWEKCSVWGNVHVRTFDESIYTFRGNCEYTLFEHKLEANGIFRVTLKTESCNVGSCIRSVTIYIKDVKGNEDKVTITAGQNFERPNQLANLVITDLDLSIMVDVVGLGVRVIWNKGGWVHIHVARVWTTWNHVGLCGKYDDNAANDFETPNKESGVTQLVDYYRVDKSCPGSAELKKVVLILTEKSCDILYSEVFKTCRFLRPVEEYYNRCLIDANLQLLIPQNERFNSYCQTLSAYAQECNDINVPVKWRTNEICPYKCQPNKVYYPCETPCPKESCQNTNGFAECPDKVCAEACNVKECPENTIYKDNTYGECIAKSQCGGTNPPCNQVCTCHTPTNDEPSNQKTIDIHLGCDDGNKSCNPIQLIFNIYTGRSKK